MEFVKYLALLLCITAQLTQLSAQPLAPLLAKSDLFTYFNPSAANLPAGASNVSKGIIHLNSFENNLDGLPGASGTAFLIRTFRDDDKICMCMTGSQVLKAWTPDTYPLRPGGPPVVPFPLPGDRIDLNTDIYMNYLGHDSISGGERYNAVSSFSKAFLGNVTLLQYYLGDSMDRKDAALILVDKSQLPSANFAMLGYDFVKDVELRDPYYTISHSHAFPQRISNQLEVTGTTAVENQLEEISFEAYRPYSVAFQSEGAPLLTNQPAPQTSVVHAILAAVTAPNNYFNSPLIPNGPVRRFYYGSGFGEVFKATNIGVLEAAIRKHCWKKADSTLISTRGDYKQLAIVDNSSKTAAYGRNAAITSTSDLTTASSSLFSESASNIEITRLNANVCNVSGFNLPSIHPGNNIPWVITLASKEINVSSDFSYTASGTSKLELSAVVFAASTALTTQQRNTQSESAFTEENTLFKIYPNPSASGMFYVSLPAAGQFSVTVYSMDGREVYHSRCETNPFKIQLPSVAKGSYVVNVYNVGDEKLAYTQLLLYL